MNARHDIVHLRRTRHWTERQIARHLHLPPATVHYWLAKADRVQEDEEPPKRGRPRVTTVDMDGLFFLESRDNPFRSAVDIRNKVAPTISVATVRKRLKEFGLRCRVPARKPFLTPVHIQKRLAFADRYFGWSVRDWEEVVFSDEKIFRASSKGPVHVYRPKDSSRFEKEFMTPSTNVTGRFTICVWMAFGKDFGEIRRVERKTLNAAYYTTRILPVIRKHFHDQKRDYAKDLIFMQDRSSIHMSKLAAEWFQANNITTMDDWPPKGPDMNPVENVWAELVRKIPNNHTNAEQLWENVDRAFKELKKTTYLSKLMASMPRRMIQVQLARGGWTKY